jgi:hypothetical protein
MASPVERVFARDYGPSELRVSSDDERLDDVS